LNILLDENFPLALYFRLHSAGFDVEHIIVLGQRGLPDASIRQRLVTEALLFLTQDTEFEDLAGNTKGIVMISRVPQRLPIADRVETWYNALVEFLAREHHNTLFELLETGEAVPFQIKHLSHRSSGP